MLIKKKTPEGLRVRTCVLATGMVLHLPLAMLTWGLVFAFTSEYSDWVTRLVFSSLLVLSAWLSARVLAHGIEFRSDSIVVHSLIRRTVIYRDELRQAACWYDKGSANSFDAFGVAFAFDPSRPSSDGASRGTTTAAQLGLAKFILPRDIRSIAVLIQQW